MSARVLPFRSRGAARSAEAPTAEPATAQTSSAIAPYTVRKFAAAGETCILIAYDGQGDPALELRLASVHATAAVVRELQRMAQRLDASGPHLTVS